MINIMFDLYIPGAALVAICTFVQGRNIGSAVRNGAIWPIVVFKKLKRTIKEALNKK